MMCPRSPGPGPGPVGQGPARGPPRSLSQRGTPLVRGREPQPQRCPNQAAQSRSGTLGGREEQGAKVLTLSQAGEGERREEVGLWGTGVLTGVASDRSCRPHKHPAGLQGRRCPNGEAEARGAELARPAHAQCCWVCLALQAGHWRSLPLSYLPDKAVSEAGDLGGSKGSQALPLSLEVPEPQAGS